MIEAQELRDCHARIAPHIHRTPVFTSRQLNATAGAQLHFLCENFQRTGSFKIRGATNAVLSLSASERSRGVVAHSSGNFAQAVALAARNAQTRAWVVMPHNSAAVKKKAVLSYGANIIECEPSESARDAAAQEVVRAQGAAFLHPSNQREVIVGQGTAGMELLESVPDLDVLLTPVGGGGLLAGCAVAAHHFGHECITLGAEPAQMDDAYRSLKSGIIQFNVDGETIADGLRTHLGDVNFPLIQQHVSQIVRVSETEIIAALRLIWERMKLLIEPSSAVSLAAILREPELFAGKRVGIVLSGGNVDLPSLLPLLAQSDVEPVAKWQ